MAIWFYFLVFCVLQTQYCSAVDSITSSKPLLNGQTLSSPGEIFELGFFSPNNSSNLYVGIWYKELSPRIVLWLANREKPVADSMACLTVSSNGNLVLLDGKEVVFWSSNMTLMSNSSTAELLDNGNFVLKNESGNSLWESFNHPSDIMLPNTTLVYDHKTGEKQVLTSWKSYTDPSIGDYVFQLEPQVPPQLFVWKGLLPYWRSGPWSKTKFVGLSHMDASYMNSVSVIDDMKTGILSYFFYSYVNSTLSYGILTPEGSLKAMSNKGAGWNLVWESQKSRCDVYGACGSFGVCTGFNFESHLCKCLKGFIPKADHEWRKGNWTGGCVRRTRLRCEKNGSMISIPSNKDDSFSQMSGLKLPDHHNLVNYVDAEGCRQECLSNCSCSAYAYVTDGIGCLIWTRPLVDLVKFSSGGEDLFIRLAAREMGQKTHTEKLIAGFTSLSIILILGALAYAFRRWRHNQSDGTNSSCEILQEHKQRSNLAERDPPDLLHFNFHAILIATNNFSGANKLGQGGFGTVYKGMLQNGKEIAVKRLSSNSGQGVEEFKNEIRLISRLQHRNLVGLLGCCVEKEERLIIYEFLANKSLDAILFDPTRKLELDWPKRFNIVEGIARGLLYLHRDSCLRVIHRDLKVSNILLDEKMNPKISDFGLARMFQGTQDLANTHRIVGTLGYMSPEYAMGGMFSEKSDVFSFGVLLLEIVSGKKTTKFNYDDRTLGLLCYAWQSWCESKGATLMDESLADSYAPLEVMRCVHIALLCVQDHAAERPTMPWIVSMLSSELELPQPKQPTFTFQKPLSHDDSRCLYEITESILVGR